MDYNEELSRYEHEAEDRYDDYNEGFGNGLDGHEDGYFVDDDNYFLDDGHDPYQATSIGKIDANDRTLTIVASNTGTEEQEAILFGGNEGAPQRDGVKVVVEESSHNEVREESKANPFRIAGMKMSVSDPLQFDNVLKVTRRSATGSTTVRVYQPRNATSPQNFSQQLIDDAGFEMDVTGQDSIRFLMKPASKVVFTFTIKARANMGNLLKGHNVAELSRSPRTTGLPQIDLLRGKGPAQARPNAPRTTRQAPVRGGRHRGRR